MSKMNFPEIMVPVDPPVQIPDSVIVPRLLETSSYIRAIEARMRYSVSGTGFTAAVMDTGLRASHEDFKNKVLSQVNFTKDNNSKPDNANDGNGHGTNIGGIICANGIHKGIAPGANIIPLKILSNAGIGSFEAVNDALEWVLDNRKKHNISVVNLSIGDGGNYTDDAFFHADPIRKKIAKLRQLKVPVVIAAGNDFFRHKSKQGMAYPAIVTECISVGAIYDADEGGFAYKTGAIAYTSGSGRITPFSQRLHKSTGGSSQTDIFAPGAPITSSGIQNDRASSIQQGTSQAAPVICGVFLLMQELYSALYTGLEKPPANLSPQPNVYQLITWLRTGGVVFFDGDDEDDNVTGTGQEFIRVDAYGALRQIRKYFVRKLSFSDLDD